MNTLTKALKLVVLPPELTSFERDYVRRLNRIALWFFAGHVPALTLVAHLNETRPELAALLAAAVLVGPLLAPSALPNPRHVSIVHGITAMLMGGLLVHFGQGPLQIEMHFYFFALIAMSAVFGNPLVVVAAAVTVALHHALVWLLLPASVFNYDAAWWVVAVHAAFVVLESVATCFIARSFFDNVIGLERIVQARTAALDSKNRDMRLLLDSVQQGFLTMTRDGRMAQERSAVVDRWFGAPREAASFFDYVAERAPTFGLHSRLAWEQVAEGILPLEVCLAQMPRRLELEGRQLQFEYQPIGGSESPEQYLVIITDVTTQALHERAELLRRETVALFEQVLADRSGIETFLEEGSQIVQSLASREQTELPVVKRLLHTLKGNAMCYSIASVADQCHHLEDQLNEMGEFPTAESLAPLVERWQALKADFSTLTGSRNDVLEIEMAQYRELEAAIARGETRAELARRVRALKLEATAKRLSHFASQAVRIAERLGKPQLDVETADHGVRVDHRRWAGFWSAFVHAIRNALDHGIEDTGERVALGKGQTGKLALRTFEDRERVVVEIADDGRGIDWARVAERAASLGLPNENHRDLEQALFTDGVSTAATVTTFSGRGVGMSALREATEELGGRISIESEPLKGTTLRFDFPASALRSLDSLVPPPSAKAS